MKGIRLKMVAAVLLTSLTALTAQGVAPTEPSELPGTAASPPALESPSNGADTAEPYYSDLLERGSTADDLLYLVYLPSGELYTDKLAFDPVPGDGFSISVDSDDLHGL